MTDQGKDERLNADELLAEIRERQATIQRESAELAEAEERLSVTRRITVTRDHDPLGRSMNLLFTIPDTLFMKSLLPGDDLVRLTDAVLGEVRRMMLEGTLRREDLA